MIPWGMAHDDLQHELDLQLLLADHHILYEELVYKKS
jgi:hypothetical protein